YIIVFCLLLPLPAYSLIIVENKELSEDQAFATEPLIGYRKASPEIFRAGTSFPDILSTVLVESAKATPEARDRGRRLGKDPSTATPVDWYAALKKTSDKYEQSVKGGQISLINIYLPDTGKNVVADPALMAGLAKKEIIKPISFQSGQEATWRGLSA